MGHQIYTSTVSNGQFINRLNCLYYDQVKCISNMSKYQQTLRHLLNNLQTHPHFPRQAILSSLPTAPLTAKEFLNVFTQLWGNYMSNVEDYRIIAIFLFMSLSKNIEGAIDNAIQFIEGMINSRLVMLIFNQKGQFQMDKVLFYLEPTLQLAVLRGLQSSKDKLLFNLLVRVNSKQRRFNPIGFLMQMLYIRKIQRYLDEISLSEFNDILKELMSPKKWSRLCYNENGLHFRYIAILRQEQDREESYYLHFLNEKRLVKMKQLSNALPGWVHQAFCKVPKQLNLLDFYSTSVSKVFYLLCQVQVFASSPFIQQFDCYTKQQIFLSIFEQFLMGLNIWSEPYEFHWQKMKRSLQVIRRNMQSQDKCYLGSIAQEIVNAVETKESKDRNKDDLF